MKAAAAPTRLPAFAIQALHVVTLTAVALTVRLYAALGDMPMFFSIRQAGAVDVLLFVLILSAALPGLVVGLLWVLGRFSRRVAATSFLILSGVLLVAIALSLCRQIPVLPDPARFAFGVVLGIAATVVYWRFFRLRAIVTILCADRRHLPGDLLVCDADVATVVPPLRVGSGGGPRRQCRAGGDGGLRRASLHFAGR